MQQLLLTIGCQREHIIIGLFEVDETIGQALIRNLIELLNQYGFFYKNIAYVKGEGANLQAMAST